MRKFLLVAIAAITGHSGFAQKTMHGHTAVAVNTYTDASVILLSPLQAKTSAVGSTIVLSNIIPPDSTRALYVHTGAGSGYVNGNNSYNDIGFAERYTFNGHDSSMKVIGVYAQFGGTVTAGSTKVITFKVWKPGPTVMVSANLHYNGYPQDVIDTLTVPFTKLGVGTGSAPDTVKQHMFAAPTSSLSGTFFVGYGMNYNYAALGGDTISLLSTQNGHRFMPDHTLSYIKNADGDTIAIDTMLNVQNATQWSDGRWYDNYTQNDSLANNLTIFPIVVIGNPTGIEGVTRNELTFFGSYPNPSSTIANIRYSLASASPVTITLLDMNGRTITTISEHNVAAGEHTTKLYTSTLPSGDYIYTIRTTSGSGFAGKLSVVR